MSLDWTLTDLYTGFDDPSYASDLQGIGDRSRQFRDTYRDRVAQLSPAELAIALAALESIYQTTGYLWSFPALIFATDTRNAIAQSEVDRVQTAITAANNDLLFFDLELQAIDSQQLAALQAAPELANYAYYLEQVGRFAPFKLPESVEQTRNRDSLTGRQAFIQLRAIHLGEQVYEPVSTPNGNAATAEAELSALLFQGDRNIREQAYRSVRAISQQHNTLYAYILSTIAQDHAIENQMRGYRSTLEKQLLADEVPEAVFQAIMQGTRDRANIWQQYYRLKAQATGQPIRTCDVYAPWTTTAIEPLPYAAGVSILLEALAHFDQNYAQRAADFFEHRWVDAAVRPGKRGGAFCNYSHGKHSYIFLSYTEDYSSLFTLAHEIGHGLHFAWIDPQQTYFNSNPPLVLAEVASTFNELLLLDYLLDHHCSDPATERALITRQLEDQLSLLFRQTTISRLELAVHHHAAAGRVDAQFINQTWSDLYRDLCGDAVEILPEHQYDWARIGHIYFKPFYCYQYAASDIVSLACYQQYRQHGRDFIPGYLQLLSAGGSENQITALKHYVGIDLEDPTTITNALDYVEGLVDRLAANL
ncbi:MAG: oligoendopeptidase F [Oscillatoriales cyanobacterium]|nr:MAG: oligoendopeptidase F [Oscillatoriales cyanobacterium]